MYLYLYTTHHDIILSLSKGHAFIHSFIHQTCPGVLPARHCVRPRGSSVSTTNMAPDLMKPQSKVGTTTQQRVTHGGSAWTPAVMFREVPSEEVAFMWAVLVSMACYSKLPYSVWLEQIFILSQFWRLKSKTKVSAGWFFLRENLSMPVSEILVVCWRSMAFVGLYLLCTCLYLNFPLL